MSLLLLVLTTAGIARDVPRSYVTEVAEPDLLVVLPPPPAPGSPLAVADAATFRQTRALQGGDRWTLATMDVTDDRYTSFACALGMTLDARTAPALARVFQRMGGGTAIDAVKRRYQRRRPYLGGDQPICEPKTGHLAGNGDYPSGHAATGWSTALLLSELVPDRATQLLARGRSFGESRYICGSHSVSGVQAGYLSAAALVATLHGSPSFRRDMEAARVELARLRRTAPPPATRCALEARADQG